MPRPVVHLSIANYCKPLKKNHIKSYHLHLNIPVHLIPQYLRHTTSTHKPHILIHNHHLQNGNDGNDGNVTLGNDGNVTNPPTTKF